MAIDVERFVTPEQQFEGLYKVENTMQQKRQMDAAEAERKRREDAEQRGKTAASVRYFTNYLDPKDRYTGTYYDPKMNELLGEALSQAYDLAQKGSNEAEILTAISPLVNKANQYQQKAKVYTEGKKNLLSSLKGLKGYNAEAISQLLDKEVFDGQDIDKVDPANLLGYMSNLFDKYGSQITNDEALDELVKSLPKSKVTTDVISYNARGGKQRNKETVEMPNIFIQEDGEGVTSFVPKYDRATDYGEDIVADFEDEKGGKVQAPVRLLEEKTFESIISSSPAVKHRLEALVNDAIKTGKYLDSKGKQITLQSPQAKNLARAILYDELKNKTEVDRSVVQENKPAQIRINMGSGSPKNTGANWVTRAMSSMKSGNIQSATDVFSELLAGDIAKFDGVEDLGGGKFKVKILPKQKYDVFGQAIQGSTNPVERTFDVNSRTLPYELQNLYQSVMGGDVKLERTYFPPNKQKEDKPSGGSWKDRAKKVQ